VASTTRRDRWTRSSVPVFGGLPAGLVGPLGEALESVYANIIEQGTLPPPVDWRPAKD
jgi:hypothetical protein